MLIHSRFKDYYDTASAYGVDTTIHFNRPPHWRQEGCKWIGLPNLFSGWSGREDAYLDVPYSGSSHASRVFQAVVGFCGWLYPVMYTASSLEQTDFRNEVFFYDYAKYKEWRKTVKERGWRTREFLGYKEDAELFRNAPYRFDEAFIELRSPVFIYRGARDKDAEMGIPLKDFQFFKVKDPVTAFQEIQMYLTNQLVKEKQPLEIEDKYRIAQHGYDKHSFRHPIKFKNL